MYYRKRPTQAVIFVILDGNRMMERGGKVRDEYSDYTWRVAFEVSNFHEGGS